MYLIRTASSSNGKEEDVVLCSLFNSTREGYVEGISCVVMNCYIQSQMNSCNGLDWVREIVA